jgi:glycosyltransferase involved in cell wall biosynthesis
MSQRARVLVVSSTYPRWRGDTEPAFVHELSRRLADTFEVTVLAPHAEGAAREEIIDGVRVLRYRYAPTKCETLVNDGGILTNLSRSRWKWLLVPLFLLAQWCALKRTIRQFQPDIVHAHWLLPQGLISAWAAGHIPVLVTSHGADLFGLRGAVFAHLRCKVIQRIASLSVVSEAMRQRILTEVPGASVELLPMGVDAERQFFQDGSHRRAQELLFVGRLVEKKGLIHLIQALPAVLTACPSATLTIIGFGPERKKLESCVETLELQNTVRFLGALSQTELPSHYRRASLFVAPFIEAAGGDQEGLGLVVAEAMACECPVVVGNVPGVRDLIDDTCGAQVDAQNHAVLAKVIIELLQDDRRRAQLASAGRARVLKHFTWSVVAAKYANLLQALATGGAR